MENGPAVAKKLKLVLPPYDLQSLFWVSTRKTQKRVFAKTCAPLCSLQHYGQAMEATTESAARIYNGNIT